MGPIAQWIVLAAVAAGFESAERDKPQVVKGPDRPNVVWILADDLAWGDPGCFGHEVLETPNLDRLAAEGVRLTDFYADAPVCSPTRAALLTGRVPQRNGLTNVIETRDHATCLNPSETLVSELLQSAGYATALVGKWHVGAVPGARPNERGFDYFFGNLLGGLGFFTHDFMDQGIHDLWQDHTPIRRDGAYVTDLLGDAAAGFIETQAEGPFFLYLAFQAVHTDMGSQGMNHQMVAPPRWIEHYAAKLDAPDDDPRVLYYACASAMDEAIGKVLRTLARLELASATFVFFTSDNGPEPRQAGSAGPYRGTKHTLWEGGIRVPALARWPGRIPAGAVHGGYGITHDLMPTTLAAAGVPQPADLTIDGHNLLPLLERGEYDAGRALCWSYIREGHQVRERVVRLGRWKWLNGELYDLDADPGEANDSAAERPELAAELQGVWEQWVRQFPVEVKRWDGRPPARREFRRIAP
jgi:arylsulfatase A